jgi:hypothetical protein
VKKNTNDKNPKIIATKLSKKNLDNLPKTNLEDMISMHDSYKDYECDFKSSYVAQKLGGGEKSNISSI